MIDRDTTYTIATLSEWDDENETVSLKDQLSHIQKWADIAAIVDKHGLAMDMDTPVNSRPAFFGDTDSNLIESALRDIQALNWYSLHSMEVTDGKTGKTTYYNSDGSVGYSHTVEAEDLLSGETLEKNESNIH